MSDPNPATPPTAADATGPTARERLAPWLLGLALGLGWWAVQPPPPRAAEAPAELPSAGRAARFVEALAVAPRPAGSEANAAGRALIVDALEGFGWAVERQQAERHGVPLENLVARWPPRPGPPADALLLVAHHDSVPSGPGAGDDAAGVAALLEVARLAPRVADPQVDLILLISDGEESGLLGARVFAEEHPALAGVRAVLNFEGRGCAGPSTLFEVGRDSGALLALLAGSTPRAFGDAIGPAVYARMPNDTDFSVFRDRGLPGLNFAFFAGASAYHQPTDTPRALDLASLQHHAELAWAVSASLLRQGWPQPWGGERRALTVPLVGMLALSPAVLDGLGWAGLAAAAAWLLLGLRAGRLRPWAVLAALPARVVCWALAAGWTALVIALSGWLGDVTQEALDGALEAVFGESRREPAPGGNRLSAELLSVGAFALAAAATVPLGALASACRLRAEERAAGLVLLFGALLAAALVGLPGGAHLPLVGLLGALGVARAARSRRGVAGLLVAALALALLLPVQHLLVHVGSVQPRQLLVYACVLGALSGQLADGLGGRRFVLPALCLGAVAVGQASLELARLG